MGGPPLPEWVLQVTGFVFPWWANLMVHSTILVSLGLFAAYAFRNRGAAVQSLMLRITLAAVLISPVVTLTAGRMGFHGVSIPLPSAVTAALETGRPGPVEKRVIPHRTTPVAVVLPTVSSAPPSAAEVAAYESARKDVLLHTTPPPSGILRVMIPSIIGIWAFLSLILIFRLLYFFLKIHLMRRSAFEAHPDLIRECEAVADDLEVESPRVLQSGLVTSPFLSGLFHPAVLLPLDDSEGAPVTREVLLHELAHLVRHDCFWNLLSQAAAAFYSVQPLLRVLSCRMEEVSDHVCDDFVVENSPNRQAYARHLYEIAERCRPTAAELAIGVGIVAFRSSLGQRVERILDSTRCFSVRASSVAAVRIMVLGGLATLLMGFTGFRGTVLSEVANITKTVSMRTATVSEELNAIMVDILPAAEVKTASAEKNVASTPETPPDLAEALPEKSPSEKPAVTPSIVTPPLTPPAPSPDAAPLSAVSGNQAAAPSAEITESGAADTAFQKQADSLSRQDEPAVSPETPAPTAPAAKVETSPPSSGQAALTETTAQSGPNLKPRDKESFIREGNRMLDIGDYSAAEKAFMKASDFDLKDPEIMNLLGKAFYGKREYDKAIIAYKRAVAKKSNFADAYYNMGDVYLAQGKPGEAMVQYKAAIRLNPAYAKRTRNFY